MTAAVVTGAASGMGRLSALSAARAGYRVAAVDRDVERLRKLEVEHDAIRGFECDVTSADAVASLAERVQAELGDVDRLVNAAGIGVGGRVGEAPLEQFRRVIDVNYLGTVNWLYALLPHMRERGSGELVIFASLAGWISSPGMGAYCASKYATLALCEALYGELRGSGVRLLCVCPPSVQTPLYDDLVDEGAVPRKAANLVRPIAPQVVVDAVDRALAGKATLGLYVLPGRGTKTLWRLRRHAPRLTRRVLGAIVD